MENTDFLAGFNRRRMVVLRRNFEEGGEQRKCRLNFDQLLERFAEVRTLSSIASEADISLERTRQIYKKWFRRLFGGIDYIDLGKAARWADRERLK